MLLWLGFLVCTGVIVYSGIKLSRYGDVIAEKTGLGKVWIGMVLMASVTSLPELVTGISSVRVHSQFFVNYLTTRRIFSNFLFLILSWSSLLYFSTILS